MITKNYIAAAALLAAGTALANAATVLTTTFDNCAQTDATEVTLTNDVDGVTASVTSLAGDSSTLDLQTSDAAGKNASFFSPNSNVGSGTPWTATFSYNLGEKSLTVDSITLNVGLFNAKGEWQYKGTSRGFSFTATLSDGSNEETFKLTDTTLDNGDYSETPHIEVALVGDSSASTFSGSVTLTLNVERASTETNGCFLGLNSIAYNNSAIPEPSAFGLLAGLGALALVASRRRRK